MIQSYDLYMPTHLIFGKGRISELKDAVAGAGKNADYVRRRLREALRALHPGEGAARKRGLLGFGIRGD